MSEPTDSNGGEPLRALALVVALVVALLALLTAFGLELTADQTSAILGVVGAVGALVVWIIGKRQVTPNKAVAAYTNVNGTVLAGEAAPLPNGEPVLIRLDGGLDPRGGGL